VSKLSKGRKKWSEEEMEEFYDAVVTIGVGRWAVVKVGGRFNVRYKADLTVYIKSHFCVSCPELKC